MANINTKESPAKLSKKDIQLWLQHLQDSICQQIEDADGTGRFIEDLWRRAEGGGGRSRIITNGNILQKGAVNFSAVSGKTPDKILQALQLDPSDFFATGVSIIMHPTSPMVPIIHMNVRYFEMDNGTYWFGGGIDLTPHYINEKDAKFFHHQMKSVCDQHDQSYYPKFKKWADDYFYINHRNETRGIGGIFFDHLKEDPQHTKEDIFEFVKSVGNSFAPTYTKLMTENNNIPYGETQKQWQLLRRGRYVEFNLVYDKGTKFGLDTNGRTESILLSMPPMATWEYDYKPAIGSEEEKTLSLLKKDIDWIAY